MNNIYVIGTDNQTQYNYKPSQQLLDNWQIQIAKQMVSQWQTTPCSQLSETSLKSIDSTNQEAKKKFAVLLDKLQLKIQQKSELTIDKFVLYDDEDLLRFSEGMAEELDKILHDSKIKNAESIEKIVAINWQKASPQKLKNIFANLGKKLVVEKNNYDKKRKQQLERQSSAWQVYFRLNQKLHKSMVNSSVDQAVADSMWRAISICFESKLKIKFLEDYCYTIKTLIKLCSTYYELVDSSCQVLEEIEKSLSERQASALNIISLPAFMFCGDTVWQQKNELETKLGHSLNYWGKSSISSQEIEQILLENIGTIVLDNYPKFWQLYFGKEDKEVEQSISASLAFSPGDPAF